MPIGNRFPDPIDNAIMYVLEKRENLNNHDYNEIMKVVHQEALQKCDSFYELGYPMSMLQQLKQKGMHDKASETLNLMERSLKVKRENMLDFWQQCIDLYDILPDSGRKTCLEKLFNHHSARFGSIEMMLIEFYNRNVYMKSAKIE